MASGRPSKPGDLAARGTRRHALAFLLLLALCSAALPAADLAELVDGRRYEELRAMGPGVMDELAELYRSRSDSEERKRVALAFYQLGWPSEAAAAALLPDVEGEKVNPRLKIMAQYALGRVSDDLMVVQVLLRNLRHSGGLRLRDKAACALANDVIHLDPRQKALLFRGLIASLDDDKPDVRRISVQVLEAHTGQRKGYDPNAPRDERLEAMGVWHRWLSDYESQL